MKTLLTDETMELIAKLYSYMDEKKWPTGQWKPHRRWWPTSTFINEHGYALGHYSG